MNTQRLWVILLHDESGGGESSGTIFFANNLQGQFDICHFAVEQPLQMTLADYCRALSCVTSRRVRVQGVCFTRQQDSQLQQHLPDTHSSGPAAHVETLLTEPLHQLHTHIASPVKTHTHTQQSYAHQHLQGFYSPWEMSAFPCIFM